MKKYMKAEEVAIALGRSVSTVYNYRRAGILEQKRVAGKKVFVREQVDALKRELAEIDG